MTERPNIIEAAHRFRAGPPLRVVSAWDIGEEAASRRPPLRPFGSAVKQVVRLHRITEKPVTPGRDPEPPEAA